MYITQNNPDGCFVSVSIICNMQIPPFVWFDYMGKSVNSQVFRWRIKDLKEEYLKDGGKDGNSNDD